MFACSYQPILECYWRDFVEWEFMNFIKSHPKVYPAMCLGFNESIMQIWKDFYIEEVRQEILLFITDSCHGGLLIVDLWEGDCHKKKLQLENQLWLSRACLAKTWKWEINATTKFHPAEIFMKYHSFSTLYIFNHFYRKYVLHPPPGGEVASLLAYENAKIPAEIFSWGGWTGYYQQQNRQELRT